MFLGFDLSHVPAVSLPQGMVSFRCEQWTDEMSVLGPSENAEVSTNGGTRVPLFMDGLFHGKSKSELDDDWG